MYLSCLLIDVGENPDRPRPGRLWLRNLYRVHQRLCMAFPSATRKEHDPVFLNPFRPDGFQHVHGQRNGDQAFLFRIDPVSVGRVAILVQSGRKPDWDYAFHNADHLLACCQIKPFDPRFAKDQVLRFRLMANPTRKIDTRSGPDGHRRHGKRVPVPAEKLEEWLTRRAEPAGFHVGQFTSIQAGYVNVYRSQDSECKTIQKVEGQGVRLRSAQYDGILRVTDPDQFQNTLVGGIGPAKAFGFGLLSVAPVRNGAP